MFKSRRSLSICLLIWMARTPLAIAQTTEAPTPTAAAEPAPAPAPAPAPESAQAPTPETAEEIIKPPSLLAKGHLLRQKDQSAMIKNLSFNAAELVVSMASHSNAIKPYVEIDGIYKRPGWQLSFGEMELVPPISPMGRKPDPKFTIFAYLNGPTSEIRLTAIGPNGETETERVFVYAPHAQVFKIQSPWNRLSLSLGIAQYNYSQTGTGSFASVMGFFSAQYDSPRTWGGRWGWQARAGMTALTLKASPFKNDPQVLEAKADLLYSKDPEGDPAKLDQFIIGMSYMTMFENGSIFGIRNLIAPEIGYIHLIPQTARSAYSLEARYVAIDTNLVNHGVNIDFFYNWILDNGHRSRLGLGISEVDYEPIPNTRVLIRLISGQWTYTF